MSETLDLVRALVARGEFLVSSHGFDELAEDGIIAEDLLASLPDAHVVEDYPDATRGPSVLALHIIEGGRPVHAVWGLAKGTASPAVLITAYRPDPARWSSNFMTRRSRR